MTQISTRPRKERKENADKRRRQLLDAARRSIIANGLARTTLATVSEQAGLSQGVAIFYYKSKNGLLTAVLEDLYQAYQDHWRAALQAAGPNPSQQIEALLEADFAPEVCNPDTLSVWFAFWGEQKFTPQYAAITERFDRARADALQDVFARLGHASARAEDLANWMDGLTDGYWQKLHLFPEHEPHADAHASALRFLRHMLGG
ncbi:MAG: TetR family transcriptional regulator C-terminal domain-containing protein [Rhodobacteraceae bacterium]|nr:TetR family transcriptional regulator C-terminal domain-containing protein [Paracoccaceae bacterium]